MTIENYEKSESTYLEKIAEFLNEKIAFHSWKKVDKNCIAIGDNSNSRYAITTEKIGRKLNAHRLGFVGHSHKHPTYIIITATNQAAYDYLTSLSKEQRQEMKK